MPKSKQVNRAVPLERKLTGKGNLVELMLHFFGNNPYYAMAKHIAGEISYSPIKQPLTAQVIQSHIKGDVVLGAYQLDQSNNVLWLGWDVDSTDRETAKKYAEKIISRIRDIPHVVEYSGSKGYHILVFLDSPMSATQAKQVVDFIRDTEGLPKTGSSHVECYPKQDKLTKSLPMGSLLKVPLGKHPKTHNRSNFIEATNGWEHGNPLAPEMVLTNLASPQQLLELLKESTDIRKAIIDLLTPHYSAAVGQHHDFCLYLSGYLAHLGWGLDDAKDIVRDLAIACGDQEIHNRTQTVTDTFRNVEQGRSVKGFSGLVDMLPGSVTKSLSELATQILAPTLVKRIDAIRLQKAASFEKIRAAASMIWADLREHGEVVQTSMNVAYWFDADNHYLMPLSSARWQAKLHHDYGLNPSDAFGTQVTEELRLRAISEARVVEVKNRTVWTGDKLYINLGGETVYILNGEDIVTAYNGECGYLFKTMDRTVEAVAPNFSVTEDIWKRLVKDINFLKSQDAPATPEEQAELLKAWMLAFFFQEMMPTKPLLLFLGVPGSGKTTAMRRILRVLESPDAEVLEVVSDKPDSLRVSLSSHRLLVLDNLEKTKAAWLVDTLNRLATGANIEIRQLYKTNDAYVIRPNCFVAMTAVSMPFSEETLFSRILPIEMQQLTSPAPEYRLQKELNDAMPGIWADLLLKLNQVVATLKRDQSYIPPIASRLADFTVFCKRIERSGVMNGALLIRGLRSLVDRQKIALLNSSPFIAVLEEWMNSAGSEADKPHTFIELFSILEPIARARKLSWRWSNHQALERHIQAMAEPLKKLYRAEFSDVHDEARGKDVIKVRFPQA